MKKYTYLLVILVLIFSSNVNAQSQYPVGSVFGPSGPTKVVDVTNPKTGRTWMDRNLGATRAATSSKDAASYGDLYQWGRGNDGHQLRNSKTLNTLSSIDQPAHGSFITVDSGFNDWHDPQNDNLWQGANGVNNPCPNGYRLPTDSEWDAERLTWTGGNNAKGAFASPLKLPMAGFRYYSDGSLTNVGSVGEYWSGTVSSAGSSDFIFGRSEASVWADHRASGFSVRCIKN